jgi:hypothetical protein
MYWLALALTAQVVSPDATGAFAVGSQTNVAVMVGMESVRADLYWPTGRPAGARSPVVIAGHGFARSSAQLANWGEHLASHGMIVVVPDFPGGFAPNHPRNGQIMRDLLAWARTAPAAIGAAPDPARGAYLGHSAGGLAAFLAAAADTSITALVGLDPVDANGLGVAAAPSIRAPTLVLSAEPSQCNARGSSSDLWNALSTMGANGSWRLRVVGATHCDPEDPTNLLCTGTCGRDAPARRTLFRRYATAHLLAAFGCDPLALPYLPGGMALAMDVSGNGLADLATKGMPLACGGPRPDAGVVDAGGPDASAADAASAPDAAATVDAALLPDAIVAPDAPDAEPAPDAAPDAGATVEPDAAAPGADAAPTGGSDSGEPPLLTVPSSGCGCATTQPTAAVAEWLLGAGLLAFARRGRRARPRAA